MSAMQRITDAVEWSVTCTEIEHAAEVLNRSGRGRAVMRDALAMLDNGGIGLDESGQRALLTLLTAAFTTNPGSARDAMREKLEA